MLHHSYIKSKHAWVQNTIAKHKHIWHSHLEEVEVRGIVEHE